MRTVGIVAEYNPFHLGHKYHINTAKEKTNSDYAVVVMSGNTVQRGDFSIIDKFTRAKEAVKNGADLVLEIPVCYS
ncbi:MAG: nucleotidyltransferase family protein, partial [Proteocatella sp.]